MNTQSSIQFLGAAGTVTGSKHLLRVEHKTILIDCGLFQGLKELRLKNWENLPVDASEIDMVILTHGHLDHVGYLPLLIKQGFTGSIHGTAPTLDIARLILLDSARIQEEDAERANAHGYSKHSHAKPLYTVKEAEEACRYFQEEALDIWIPIDSSSAFRFRYNGHILGATFVELWADNKNFVFSGDIGRRNDPLLHDPNRPERADVLIIESTYGNRIHPPHPKERLKTVIEEALQLGGPIIIPSFAVERTQMLMLYLWELWREDSIPDIPIYMDSPMGTHVLSIFRKYAQWHKLSAELCDEITGRIHLIRKVEETFELSKSGSPKIILAASGMASGGRVLTYFERFLGDPSATILLVGYQGEGTRGRALLEGAKEIKMRGKFWPVRANIAQVEGLSAHADQEELLYWVGALHNKPSHVFIVHGETDGALALQRKLKELYGIQAQIPQLNETFFI